MRNQKFSASERKAHGLANKESVHGVKDLFVSGEITYRDDSTAAFTPDEDINLYDHWKLYNRRFLRIGGGWNPEVGMAYDETLGQIHLYPNGTIAMKPIDVDELVKICEDCKWTPIYNLRQSSFEGTPLNKRKTIRNRVVSTSNGIVRESPTDATLRVRVTKDGMAASGSTIRELLDREVYKLLSQLPS